MSIATELQRILATKKDLRNALNIDDSVPFSNYAAHIPWHGETPPANAKFFDFMNDRYSADGVPVALPALGSTFTRLSSATQWQSGVLVDVAANVMRIDKSQGLLIEPQRTNSASSIFAVGTAVLSLRGDGALGSEFIDVSWAINASNYISVASGSNNNRSISCILSNIPNEGVVINIAGGINLCKVFPDGTSTSLNAAVVSLKSTKVSSGVYVAVGIFLDVPSPFRIYASSAAGVFTIDALSVEYSNSSPTSLMSRLSRQTTRAKETFIVTLAPGQTITSDKDPGIVMTMLGNDAVFEGHGHLRYIWVD